MIEVELARRRLVVAKAERIDTAPLQLEFAAKLAALDALGGQLAPAPADDAPASDKPARGKTKHRPTGRRQLRELDLPEERIGIPDPALEGTAPRMGTEDNYKLMWRRGGFVRLVVARVKYRVGELADDASPAVATAEVPGELVMRSIAAPSLLAHVVSDKLCDGLPLHRQEDRFARIGTRIDRGTTPIMSSSSTRPRRPAPLSARCSATSPATSRPMRRASMEAGGSRAELVAISAGTKPASVTRGVDCVMWHTLRNAGKPDSLRVPYPPCSVGARKHPFVLLMHGPALD